MRKCNVFVLFLYSCSVCLIFYAFSLNVRSFSGNIFLNVFLLSTVEVPANLSPFFCLHSKLGRKGTFKLILYFLFAGVACFTCIPLLIFYGERIVSIRNIFLLYFLCSLMGRVLGPKRRRGGRGLQPILPSISYHFYQNFKPIVLIKTPASPIS